MPQYQDIIIPKLPCRDLDRVARLYEDITVAQRQADAASILIENRTYDRSWLTDQTSQEFTLCVVYVIYQQSQVAEQSQSSAEDAVPRILVLKNQSTNHLAVPCGRPDTSLSTFTALIVAQDILWNEFRIPAVSLQLSASNYYCSRFVTLPNGEKQCHHQFVALINELRDFEYLVAMAQMASVRRLGVNVAGESVHIVLPDLSQQLPLAAMQPTSKFMALLQYGGSLVSVR